MVFKEITIKDRELLQKFLFKDDELSCETTFINLAVWQKLYNNCYSVVDNMLFLRSDFGGGFSYSIPYADDMKKAVELLLSHTAPDLPVFWAQDGERFKKLKEVLGDNYSFIPERDAFDYIYSREKLSTLSGKKYHSKRNHISAFSKKYNYEYQKITAQNINAVKRCAEEWYDSNADRLDSTMLAEKQGVFFVLDNLDKLKARGGAIFVENKVVAFTLGSKVNSKAFDIHIEKALPEFSEAYAVINRDFCQNELKEFEFINREDDLGLEGLRRAKLSYKPEFLLNKYVCLPKIAAAREIYNEAFGVSKEFDDALFNLFGSNIEAYFIEDELVSFFFKIPCKLVQNGVKSDAYYLYAVATKQSKKKRGYMRALLDRVYGNGDIPLILKPQTDDVILFYEKCGFQKITATPKLSDTYIEITENHKNLLRLSDKASDDYLLMYRYNKKINSERISFSETLE